MLLCLCAISYGDPLTFSCSAASKNTKYALVFGIRSVEFVRYKTILFLSKHSKKAN